MHNLTKKSTEPEKRRNKLNIPWLLQIRHLQLLDGKSGERSLQTETWNLFTRKNVGPKTRNIPNF